MCICLRQGSAKSRLLRPLAGANNPEFPRPSLRNGQLCRCLRWRQKHVGLLSHRKCLVRAPCRVFCGLLVQRQKAVAWGSRTQHLHRLQVASVASGLSQSVPLVSFMPMSVDPSVSSTIFGLLCKRISLSMLCVAKQSMFFMLPLSSMALVSPTPKRVSVSALQSHLLLP